MKSRGKKTRGWRKSRRGPGAQRAEGSGFFEHSREFTCVPPFSLSPSTETMKPLVQH